MKFALLQHHKEYVHGNNGPNTFDCAGLVWFVYNEILNINLYENGFGISTTTRIMTNNLGKLTLFEENSLNKDLNLIKNGDIIFFHRQSLKDMIPKEIINIQDIVVYIWEIMNLSTVQDQKVKLLLVIL